MCFFAGANSTVLLLRLAGRFVVPPLVDTGGGGTDGRTVATDGRNGTVAGVIGGDCGACAVAGVLDADDIDGLELDDNVEVDADGDDDESSEPAVSSKHNAEDDISSVEAVSASDRDRDCRCGFSESDCDEAVACGI